MDDYGNEGLAMDVYRKQLDEMRQRAEAAEAARDNAQSERDALADDWASVIAARNAAEHERDVLRAQLAAVPVVALRIALATGIAQPQVIAWLDAQPQPELQP